MSTRYQKWRRSCPPYCRALDNFIIGSGSRDRQFSTRHCGDFDAGLDVTSETIAIFQSLFLGIPADHVGLGGFVLRMLPLTAIAVWSMTDAARSASKPVTAAV